MRTLALGTAVARDPAAAAQIEFRGPRFALAAIGSAAGGSIWLHFVPCKRSRSADQPQRFVSCQFQWKKNRETREPAESIQADCVLLHSTSAPLEIVSFGSN